MKRDIIIRMLLQWINHIAEPIEDNDKHETIKEAENNTEHSTVSDKSEAEQSQQPEPYLQQVLTKQIHQKINMMM